MVGSVSTTLVLVEQLSEVAAWLERQGVTVRFASQGSSCLSFPELSIRRLSAEFEPPGAPFLQTLLEL